MKAGVLAALAEPNRLRIVELLAGAPRSVGEIASQLDLRQPQVTKHLQTLERAGLVTMHPLGRRRIYALRRPALRELEDWAGSLTGDHPSERVLAEYQAAIEAERVLAHRAREAGSAREFVFERDMRAPAARVWRAWTSADEVRRWWSPVHFEVVECIIDAVVDGPIRIVLGEADGSRYASTGRFLLVEPTRRLAFELSPLDEAGRPLFMATYSVRLIRRRASATRLSIRIVVTDVTDAALPALAGIQIGWDQLLDKLAAHLAEREGNGS